MNSASLQNGKRAIDLCIVGGAGHVGLPLAIVCAKKGLRVLVYDINQKTLDTIARGIVPFAEDDAEPLLQEVLASEHLLLSSDPADIAGIPTLIITIGTPVDEFMNPVFAVVEECITDLLPYISDGQLLVLRSTVYPGTTDRLDKHLKSQNRQVLLSFCPERIVQGKAIKELQELPQIVSGTTPEAEAAASRLFGLIAPELVSLTPIEAEFAKLFNNAYRYISFAIANQFYMMTHSAGVDYYRVLDGMKKNYPRASSIPRAGFAAGPCLFKDTMQLAAFFDNQFTLGQAAMLVNEGLVAYMVKDIAAQHDLSSLTVGLLGMAFKADIDDTRSSLSYKLKKLLKFKAARVVTTDPHVTTDKELLPLDTLINESDLLILCVPHKVYRNLDTRGKPVIDIWGYLESLAAKQVPVL
jgi:UDP-N-acetyl-D-mannosaminuronic acid dehydrogenase